jgi:hypothetical protein
LFPAYSGRQIDDGDSNTVTVSNVFDEDVRNGDLSTKKRRATEMASTARSGILLYRRWDRLGFSELGIKYIFCINIYTMNAGKRKNNTL